jgi:SAM-dependent methyltransferase/uncharacterized protein YbaR (Trm112 family)
VLKSLVPKLTCPTCLQSDAPLGAHAFDDGADGHIRNGIVHCPRCKSVFPIEEDLLELVPPSLLDPEDYRKFGERFSPQLTELNASITLTAGGQNTDVTAQLKQREHFDWYAQNEEQTYHEYAKSPFWVAVDDLTFARWKSLIAPGGWLLDVGCANGRASFPWVDDQPTNLVGFDISKRLVRQAIERSRNLGGHARTTFLVGDGNSLPFANESFDYAMTYGVLHHLPDPGVSCGKIIDILKPGGIYFGSENNRTIFRALFDLSMKLKPLWTEEAGAEPLISRTMLRDWTGTEKAKLNDHSMVFLPPHLFNLMGHRIARPLMSLSDKLARLMPFLRHHGGLIVFEIHKRESSTSP